MARTDIARVKYLFLTGFYISSQLRDCWRTQSALIELIASSNKISSNIIKKVQITPGSLELEDPLLKSRICGLFS